MAPIRKRRTADASGDVEKTEKVQSESEAQPDSYESAESASGETEEKIPDEAPADAYAAAHEDYLARRAELGRPEEIEGVSAGGMPTRVKCLHALVGHALAAGRGVNPIGDLTLAVLIERGLWDPARCLC